jgi:hypothetical protein
MEGFLIETQCKYKIKMSSLKVIETSALKLSCT